MSMEAVVGFREGNIVTQIKTIANDGYDSVQVGNRRVRDKKLTKPEMGHLEKSGIIPLRHLQELRLQDIEGFETGQKLAFEELFKEGDLVDVSGTTIGKGFQGSLCIFGEIVKRASRNPNLRPKPHLYVSMMREVAATGDYNMVRSLHKRMWADYAGTISTAIQEEADHLLMEAALNEVHVGVAIEKLTDIITRWEGISWTSRGCMMSVKRAAEWTFSKKVLGWFMAGMFWCCFG